MKPQRIDTTGRKADGAMTTAQKVVKVCWREVRMRADLFLI